MPSPGKPVSVLRLIQYGDTKIMAGHDAEDENVYVLRKYRNRWELHLVPIAERDEALRSFLSAEQSETGELTKAIDQVCRPIKSKRKRRV